MIANLPLAGPDPADLTRCVHCGFCLQHCPTYVATGLETESPRGRLYLMRSLAEGRVELTDNALAHLDRCILCRNCEAVCPSSVPYGRIMQAERAAIQERRKQGSGERLARWLVFKQALPHPARLRALGGALRMYQRTGMQRVVRTLHLPSLLPKPLRAMEALTPDLRQPPYPPPGLVAPALGEKRGRVALLAGCVMPAFTPEVHAATVRVLTLNGFEVVVPAAQGCCGALHTHAGEHAGACDLARRNIDALLADDIDAVVVNAAGCGAEMKEYDRLLAGDPAYARRADDLAHRVVDITEFLAREGLRETPGPLNLRVTYQDSCHLAHAQRITRAPRELLRAIPGLEFVEMPHADRCCGSGGIYNIVQADLAAQVLAGKMEEVQATQAQVVATANPGCMMQIAQGINACGMPAQAVHVVQVLDWAYGGPGRPAQG